ncbi:MAG: hypothetical protein ACI8SE_000405 [Bacteroidia bacterium]|jgi:hypothetical protein
MRQGWLIILLLISFSISVNGQNFGNSSFLKYGLTQNDLSIDVSHHEFTLTNSPGKAFLLRNVSSEAFGLRTGYLPNHSNSNAETSGELLRLSSPELQSGFSAGYAYTTKKRQQGFLRWNKAIKLKNKAKKIQFSGYSMANVQEFNDSRGLNSWSRQNQNNSIYTSLTNADYNAKNVVSFQSYLLVNTGAVQYGFENPQTTSGYNDNGMLWLSKLNWKRKLSLNHALNSTVTYESFNNDVMPQYETWQDFRASSWFSFSQLKFQISDEIKLQKHKITNELVFADNRQEAAPWANRKFANYQIGLWQTSITHFFKSNITGLKYHHALGVHSDDALIYNPGVKFFHKMKQLKLDFGANQVSRTPALATEFGTFYHVSQENTLTTSQEHIIKIFATTHLAISSLLSLEFKYLQTASNDKWLFDPVQNQLRPQALRYSAFYGKLLRNNQQGSRYMFVYRYITPETASADILAQHFISGNYEYLLKQRALKHIRWFRHYDLFFDLKTSYISKHKLPFWETNQQAIHKGGFFADAHVKVKFGNRYYYYQQNYDKKKINNVVLKLGVNNILNTSNTIQPLSSNEFKPILPRQLFTSITLDF